MGDSIHRRDFMKHAGAAFGLAAGAGSLDQMFAQGRKIGPNDKISVAIIGTNGRGIAHVQCLTGIADVEVSYICDVDDRAIEKGVKETLKKQKNEPKGLKDFRKALADKSVDAITIATPDHWHTPMAVMGLAAGKHVYLEKPLSHNAYEGELLTKAVQKSGRVFEMGAQRRSFPNIRAAIQQIHDGAIGKAYFGRAWYTNNRASIGHGKPAEVPGWLDYELWQGPALRKPYRDNLIHYNWHWFWNYGTGETLNNGTHEVDVCRWALGVNFPTRVTSSGGRYQFQDDWETPDTNVVTLAYPEGKAIAWEGRSCNDYPSEGLDRGAMIYGTEGAALLDANSYTFWDKKKKVMKQVHEKAEAAGTNTLSATGMRLDQIHFENFLGAVRGGNAVNCPVEEGHKSVVGLHLANIAWRVGRELHCDPANGHIKNDAEAMKLWRREYEKGWEPSV